MERSTFRLYAIFGQVGLLLIFFLINLVESYSWVSFSEACLLALNYTLMVAGVVAVNYFYVLPYYLKGKKLHYFVLLFLVMTGFIILFYAIDAVLPVEYEEEDESESIELIGVIYDYLLLIISTAYTSLYYFVEQWFQNISTKAQLRNEKLQAELNFLKSQINPHFLFNTLNNIYAYAQTGNEKTAPMLERLSSILRYMVYDCSEDRVSLNKELVAVEDLLEITKMKSSIKQNITLSTQGVKGYHLIAPLIVVTLVENASKHSDAVSNFQGFIDIRLSVDTEDDCLFEISNSVKKKSGVTTKYGGVGSENVKKRLDLQYGGAYELDEEESDAVYKLKLRIPLERKQ